MIPIGSLNEEQIAQMRLLLQIAKGKLPQVLPLEEVDPLEDVSYLDVAVVSAIWDDEISHLPLSSARRGENYQLHW